MIIKDYEWIKVDFEWIKVDFEWIKVDFEEQTQHLDPNLLYM
jgi:hypothetical protein